MLVILCWGCRNYSSCVYVVEVISLFFRMFFFEIFFVVVVCIGVGVIVVIEFGIVYWLFIGFFGFCIDGFIVVVLVVCILNFLCD